MQMSLGSNTGCYKKTGVNMYDLYPMSGRRGVWGKISVHGLRGRASFQCAGILEFLCPSPVQINHERSLRANPFEMRGGAEWKPKMQQKSNMG